MARTKNRFNGIAEETPVRENAIKKSYRVGLYARLSVDKEEKKESIDTQLQIMKDYIKGHAEFMDFREYIDNGFSGTNFERPGFTKLMEDVKGGKINCIMVKDLSRFGRDYLETTNYIEVILPFLRVRLISVNDHFDTDEECNSNKELEITLKNLVNDMYAKDISKKIFSSKAIGMRKGRRTGGFPPYGYRKNPEDGAGAYLVNEETAAVVRKVFDGICDGESVAGMARLLQEEGYNIPSVYRKTGHLYHKEGDPPSLWRDCIVSRIIKNEAHIGRLIQGKTRECLYNNEKRHVMDRDDWVIKENAHEAIVTEDVFFRANDICRKRLEKTALYGTDKRGGTKHKYDGLLYCGCCEKQMWHTSYSGVLKDGTKKKYGSFFCGNHAFHADGKSLRLPEAKLDELVMAQIKSEAKRLMDKDYTVQRYREDMLASASTLKKKVSKIEWEIEGLENELFLQYEAYSDGKIEADEYRMVRSGLEDKLSAVKERLMEAKDSVADVMAGIDVGVRFIKGLYRANGKKRLDSELLHQLIERISVFAGGKIVIKWRFSNEGCGNVSETVHGG